MLFQLQITAFGSQFLQQVLTATKYLAVDHPELSPPWRGILREATQLYGIEQLLSQELVGWDPRYGLPLLHNYTIIAGNITASGSTFFCDFRTHALQIEWFTGEQLFQFIKHIVGQTTSPACIFVQTYRQYGNNAGVWSPAVPNNTLLATVIGMVSFSLTIRIIIIISQDGTRDRGLPGAVQ